MRVGSGSSDTQHKPCSISMRWLVILPNVRRLIGRGVVSCALPGHNTHKQNKNSTTAHRYFTCDHQSPQLRTHASV